jgi:hypothetical protein
MEPFALFRGHGLEPGGHALGHSIDKAMIDRPMIAAGAADGRPPNRIRHSARTPQACQNVILFQPNSAGISQFQSRWTWQRLRAGR